MTPQEDKSIIPPMPKKTIAIKPATIRAIGRPLNAFGVLAASKRTRMQAKRKMTSKKPRL